MILSRVAVIRPTVSHSRTSASTGFGQTTTMDRTRPTATPIAPSMNPRLLLLLFLDWYRPNNLDSFDAKLNIVRIILESNPKLHRRLKHILFNKLFAGKRPDRANADELADPGMPEQRRREVLGA